MKSKKFYIGRDITGAYCEGGRNMIFDGGYYWRKEKRWASAKKYHGLTGIHLKPGQLAEATITYKVIKRR